MEEKTDPDCNGHNWEIGQVRPEWTVVQPTTGGVNDYQEIAFVVCSFCGIVRKTRIKNL